jgi:glycosyltransferase involved in cell wall biosynthesis
MAQISIILPTLNRSWCIERCLNSIFSQTFHDWDLWLIDDGSEDETAKIIEPYLKDQRLRYHYQNHSGVSRARNTGIKLSDSNLICLIDSDDLWLPKKLEKQLLFHKQWHSPISQCKEIWIRNGIRVNPPKHLEKKNGDLFEESLKICAITPSSVMLEREILNKYGLFDENFMTCEDYDLWLRITPNHQVGLLDEALLIRHGGHQDQLSSRYPLMDWYRIQSLAKLLMESQIRPDQIELAKKTFIQKCKILHDGAIKRENLDIIQKICEIRSKVLD